MNANLPRVLIALLSFICVHLCSSVANYQDSVNVGSLTISPPFSAD